MPEGGIVQLLHVHNRSWGAILLPDDHHAVLSDCVLIRWHLPNIPNLVPLASCSSLLLVLDFNRCRDLDSMGDNIKLDGELELWATHVRKGLVARMVGFETPKVWSVSLGDGTLSSLDL